MTNASNYFGTQYWLMPPNYRENRDLLSAMFKVRKTHSSMRNY